METEKKRSEREGIRVSFGDDGESEKKVESIREKEK